MLRRFENGLFGGGLGKLTNVKPARIKLKPGAKPFEGRYYNLPKAYEAVAKREIERLVSIGVLKRLPWNPHGMMTVLGHHHRLVFQKRLMISVL
jgi:glutamate synthase domain-containing protein 2